MRRVEKGIVIHEDELIAYLGEELFGKLLADNYLQLEACSENPTYIITNENSEIFIIRAIQYAKKFDTLDEKVPIYKLCNMINPQRRGITYKLYVYCMLNNRFVDAISYILNLVEGAEYEPNTFYENIFCLCVLYDIVERMINTGRIDQSIRESAGYIRFKALAKKYKDKFLTSLMEGSLLEEPKPRNSFEVTDSEEPDTNPIDENIGAVIELALYGYYSLAWKISHTLSISEHPKFKFVFSILYEYKKAVLNHVKRESIRDTDDEAMVTLILGRRYRLLKRIYTTPHIAGFLSFQINYQKKIELMIMVLDELIKLEEMSKEDFEIYVSTLKTVDLPIEESLDTKPLALAANMIRNGDLVSAYYTLLKTQGRGCHKLFFLLEQYVNAVRPFLPNPNIVGPYPPVILSLGKKSTEIGIRY